MTLCELIEANASVRGDALALTCDDRSCTFAQLATRARALASAFAAYGLRHQDRVAILAQNCLEYCETYAACERGGFIVVTVNFRLSMPEVAHVIRDSGARILVFEASYADAIGELRNELPIEFFLCIGPAPPWATNFSEARAVSSPPMAQYDDIGFLIYTSGTTGKPKGCILGQREEVEKARITAADIGISSADRILLCMPLFHIGAKAMLTAQHWMGGAAFLQRTFRPQAILTQVEHDRITILHLAPTMVQSILEQPDIGNRDLSSLRAIVYSAAAMPLEVLKRGIALLGPVFYQIYGLTEGIGTILGPQYHRVDGDERDLRRLKSVGVPSPGVGLRIVDESDSNCANGVAGEILLRTPAAARGYWNDSGATIDTLRGGWVHTGDIGFRDEDGFIFIVDRKKDMIISGGENIYSREVEDALYQHPAVSEVAVIGVSDPKWGEAVRAVVALRTGSAVRATELIEHVRGLIASYKKPRDIIFVRELPKMANGKIDKQAIRRDHSTLSSATIP